MTQAGERIYGEFGAPAERAAILFVSASAEDARAFRELVDRVRWLVVNVPDLAGARAVIDKLHPRLVVCDTGIEGRGSWRDLLPGHDARPSFALVVATSHAGEALRAEIRHLGGSDVLEKPFAVEDVERAIVLGFQCLAEERGAAAPCSRRG